MKSFAKELGDILRELRLSQTAFADRIDMPKPKLCRLIKGTIACNRSTLDIILGGLPEQFRTRLVNAYFRDLASPLAIGYLRGRPEGDDWDKLDELPHLSRKGRAAFRALMHSDFVPAMEKFLINFAEIMKLPIKA